jgi:hypothetical protein
VLFPSAVGPEWNRVILLFYIGEIKERLQIEAVFLHPYIYIYLYRQLRRHGNGREGKNTLLALAKLG